jgi:SSS family solute:Na+ symporter
MDTIMHRTLSTNDWVVVGVFLAFISSIGFICKRMNKNSSDYFRGGGNMVWWLAGISTVFASISAWSFTGGAAKAYKDGIIFLIGGFVAIPIIIVVLYFWAPLFRRFRVITSMEAVFRRFGTGTEQFYTWITLPLGLFFGAVGLNTIAVFLSSVLNTDVVITMSVTAALIILLASMSGQWGVTIGAFVLGLTLFLCVVATGIYAMYAPEIGGPGNLTSVLPAKHLDITADIGGPLAFSWIGFNVMVAILNSVDIRNTGKFIRLKDESHARKMALVMLLPVLTGFAILMQIPSMCSAVVFPDIAQQFPDLKHPEEAAWIAMAMHVLPDGLLGLIVCGIFAAAFDGLDAGLNGNAGFFVKNVYYKYINPRASEKRQLIMGKISTVVLGILTLGFALAINSMRTLNLFDFYQVFNAIILPSILVPVSLGMIIKRSPGWSGWSSVLVGIAVGCAFWGTYDDRISMWVFGIEHALTPREAIDSKSIIVGSANFLATAAWFVISCRFYASSDASTKERVESLIVDLGKPIDRKAEGYEDQDNIQYEIVGMLSIVLGGLVMMGAIIPNPWHGRLTFLVIGGLLTIVGAALYSRHDKIKSES